MDEPASALDPIATSKIEDLIDELAAKYTVVIITHNVQQAARISDRTAVFLIIFENPESDRVENYITGMLACVEPATLGRANSPSPDSSRRTP